MDKTDLKARWTQLKGSARERWGRLTGDDVEEIQGDLERLQGKLAERYGESREKVMERIKGWLHDLEDRVDESGSDTSRG